MAERWRKVVILTNPPLVRELASEFFVLEKKENKLLLYAGKIIKQKLGERKWVYKSLLKKMVTEADVVDKKKQMNEKENKKLRK